VNNISIPIATISQKKDCSKTIIWLALNTINTIIENEKNKMVEKVQLKKNESLYVVLVAIMLTVLISLISFTSYKMVIVAVEATSSQDPSVQADMNNPDNIISATGQGYIQCLSGGSNYRPAEISFGVNKAGETMTGSFNIGSNTDSKSLVGGSIDGGQMISGDQYRILGTTEGGSNVANCDRTDGSNNEGNSASTTTTPSNPVVPARITITGQCGGGSTIQYSGANGQIGTFAGNVECYLTDNNENYYPPSGNNQYQSEEEEYGDFRQSNEFRQGSQAFQQCIEAAADVGNQLSDYEIRNCQENPSYRH
jgi:hypothetical protein